MEYSERKFRTRRYKHSEPKGEWQTYWKCKICGSIIEDRKLHAEYHERRGDTQLPPAVSTESNEGE